MTISAPWLGLFAPKIPIGCYLYVKSVLEKNERKKFEISFKTLFSQNYLNSQSLSNPLKTKNESMIDRAIEQQQQRQQQNSSKTLFSSLLIVLFLKISPFILSDIKNKQYLNVCVISGKQDILVDLQSIKKRLVNNIKPMNFKILDSGHCVNIETVAQYNKIIVDHIDESNKLNILKRNNNNCSNTYNIKSNYLCNNNNNITNYFFKNILKFFKK